MKKRVGILISGRGSNMMSLVAAARDPAYPAEIVAIISNRPEAPGLEWAKAQGMPAVAIDHQAYPTRTAFEAQMHKVLTEHRCDLIACCGFLRLMTADFVNLWHDRMLNIHPALLPAYKGLHTHERALADGVRIHGCTVHIVRAEMDAGPILGQAAVAVLDGDTPDSLAARVLAAEHRLYPHALALYAAGRATVTGETIRLDTAATAAPSVALTLFSPPV